MNRYGELDDTHRRIAEQQAEQERKIQEQRDQERTAQEAIDRQAQLEHQQAEHRKTMEDVKAEPKTNYQKNMDVRDDGRALIAGAILEGDEQKQAQLMAKAKEAGLNPNEEWQAADRLARDQQFQKQHVEKVEQDQRPQEIQSAVKERADGQAEKEASDKGREQTDRAQKWKDWMQEQAAQERQRDRGMEM